ncbi:AAA family ATPase [Thermococcus barophilus]|uniref:ATPase AAA-type core domain-containing protein n=1 Tax=Thermococcus barophilus TaxID=55802 RepID=A0A0S1X9X7_THEBA|nr:AAA family ATPase [Thermococcus barophilus]ALM74561.1 hypothetical protein TBCH5v1_0601 [Thermococcus barophilus]
MLIEEIVEIKEFRGIKELAEPLSLKKFNVLIGKNNSGKSALLEALFLFPHPDRTYQLLPKSWSIKNFIGNRRSGLKSLVYKYEGRTSLKFKAKIEKGIDEWTITISSKGNSKVFQNNQKVESSLKFKESLYFPYDTQFIKGLDEFLDENEEALIKGSIHTKVAKMISAHLDERFTEIVLKKDGWYLRREDASYIHIDDVGEGVKKAARIMMVAELLKPKLILWDDFDTSLHPSMIKMLLKWLAQGDWQVVIATHSIDVLYYLADLNEELDNFDAQLILLRKDQGDILHHKELNMDELEDLLEGNVDPRMLVDVLKI